jgi:hypothetical protein
MGVAASLDLAVGEHERGVAELLGARELVQEVSACPVSADAVVTLKTSAVTSPPTPLL